jgi:hypothetical protein
MSKVLIIVLLCAISLNAQSTFYPNNRPTLSLEQSLLDNTLSLAEPEHIINNVIFYNRETLERKIYENNSKSIDINLDDIKNGLYTAMVYVNGDIIVINVDVKGSRLNKNIETSAALSKPEEKMVRLYRVIYTVHYKYSERKFNVFTAERKNNLIRKNIFELTTSNGKRNSLVIYAVYLDNSEALIYETEAPKVLE